jgi:hypothetical protein
MYEFVSLLVQLFDHCLSLPIDVFMIFNVSATIRPQSWQLYGSFLVAWYRALGDDHQLQKKSSFYDSGEE